LTEISAEWINIFVAFWRFRIEQTQIKDIRNVHETTSQFVSRQTGALHRNIALQGDAVFDR